MVVNWAASRDTILSVTDAFVGFGVARGFVRSDILEGSAYIWLGPKVRDVGGPGVSLSLTAVSVSRCGGLRSVLIDLGAVGGRLGIAPMLVVSRRVEAAMFSWDPPLKGFP